MTSTITRATCRPCRPARESSALTAAYSWSSLRSPAPYRKDPFTRRPAYHSGIDFAGGLYSPINATGPGVVSYTGVRNGYGNVVEIDHGDGFKTRYAHRATLLVKRGERVAGGQRIAGMGSTGRSTGSHLHYEVWVNGRAQNPDRFLRAGDYVQQANQN